MEDDVRERGAKVGVVYENKKRFELSYQLFGSCPPANLGKLQYYSLLHVRHYG